MRQQHCRDRSTRAGATIPVVSDGSHVFLSYAKEDADQVRRLHFRLRQDGIRPWLDEHDLLPGQEWDAAIRHAIRASTAFVVCLSTRAVSKTGYIQREIREALDVTDALP